MSLNVTFYTQHCSINLSPKCIDPSNYYPDRSVLLHRYEPFRSPQSLLKRNAVGAMAVEGSLRKKSVTHNQHDRLVTERRNQDD
jgi:hypothetical protein